MAVKNAPPVTVAVNKLELRIAIVPNEDNTAGDNAGSAAMHFEQRCVQETGTH
jgi:hypothetical protein